MQPLKPLSIKSANKAERERLVLLGLVELHIKTGKPIGSNTLREEGFEALSSATIRNYFTKLEKSGFLKQQHSSGGRIPTTEGFQLYAEAMLEKATVNEEQEKLLRKVRHCETKEIATHLQQTAELLSELSDAPIFLSAPRFDHDFILHLKLISIDHSRCLAVIITDFGHIHTETLHTSTKLSTFSLKRLEEYFTWRLTSKNQPHDLTEEEEALALKFYNEVLVRYVVGYSNFTSEEIYTAGLSCLLHYADFDNAVALSNSLSLFENPEEMRSLLRKNCQESQLNVWMGSTLKTHAPLANNCAVITIPYYINQIPAGTIALLGPERINYPTLFGVLRIASEYLSESLTKSVTKHRITYRQPNKKTPYLDQKDLLLIDQSRTS